MEPLIIVVGLLVAAGVAYFAWQQGVKRREALHALAVTKGLTWTRHDHVGISANHPFKLWMAGDERKWENTISGALDGKPVLMFDYQYTEVSRDAEGKTQRTTYKFTCAVAPLDGAFTPGLQLSKESLFSRLKDATGFRDLELESEAFNKRFEVGTRDRKFAVAFLDARMINWLMTTPTELRFEVLGGHVLVAGPQVGPDQWMLRQHIANDFASRMPDVVRSYYPA